MKELTHPSVVAYCVLRLLPLEAWLCLEVGTEDGGGSTRKSSLELDGKLIRSIASPFRSEDQMVFSESEGVMQDGAYLVRFVRCR